MTLATWSWVRLSGEHLSPVEGLVGGVIVVEQTHVDEVDQQARSVLGGVGIICCPLVEDQQDEVPKQARHENDLWDEAQKDVERFLEVPVGRNRATEESQLGSPLYFPTACV